MQPTSESVLATLTQERLLDLSKTFGIAVHAGRENKKQIASKLGIQLTGQLPAILRELGRDELRAACRAHAVADTGIDRRELQERLLVAAGYDPRASVPPPPDHHADGLPRPGQVVQLRHRQWLVEGVAPGEPGESPLVSLVCLDDDAPGEPLEVLWDLELGARILAPESHGLGRIERLDAPAHFGAYLHALEWSAVSAADASRFQAPFRAGIKLMAHQLTPLMKALELPRANLFIADDVGLGKTIEAGLVLQELLLRQQADFVLIACPASICLQWRTEMQRRFGLRFEVMTRQLVAQRRKERGFGVNPWSTHNRFIVSHALLRRPEYRDPLLQRLGARARKGLFILDEAHVAAPATRSKYAVDSDVTRTIRDLAPKFDNRLFLSATPHNGHSNSFSALLEILDPVRFTRGVPVEGKDALAPVMVRRLKRDLRKLGVERFPRRLLVKLALHHGPGGWRAEETRYDAETGASTRGETAALGEGPPIELELAEKLARYTELSAPKKGRGRLPFIRLQQRLLSSPEAFAKSLEAHAAAVSGAPVVYEDHAQASIDFESDPELHGVDDAARDADYDAAIARESEALLAPAAEAKALLESMRALAARARRAPDAKTRALFAFLRANLCAGIGVANPSADERAWSERRVILFTEWADTKRYLHALLTAAIEATDRAEERICVFHGGMSDEAREEVQRAFNAPPSEHPVRILIATDAAREGINLQAHCADLFHVDLPWNPARLEQRNGRIDRTLQPKDEVRCHYFVYPERPEDRVLETLVRKVETVQRELGSLGAVLLDAMGEALEPGIVAGTEARLEAIGSEVNTATVVAELESQRDDLEALRAEVARAGRLLEASKRALAVDPEALRGVVEVGLGMAGAEPLTPAGLVDGRETFTLPALDRSWDGTLDVLRPPRGRDEAFWEWRKRAPRPVTFAPLERLGEDVEQLHLAHPLVKRVLDRFLAQGYSAHDLSRVTALVAPDESVARLFAYARLTLFGPGAARLHDEVLVLAAPYPDALEALAPYRDAATASRAIATVSALLAKGAKPPPAPIRDRLVREAPALFAALWPALEAEADARAVAARNGLAQRARREATELTALLERQKRAIEKAATKLKQGDLFAKLDAEKHKDEQRQVRLDLEHMEKRREALDAELRTEPEAIAALYDVRMTRLTPVGLVLSWPEAMT